MALIKHIAIKNISYSDTIAYLKFEHDEFTNKPILDENGAAQGWSMVRSLPLGVDVG